MSLKAAVQAAPFAGLKAVEPRHQFDEAALHRWMEAHVEGYAGPLSVMQFKGGQSNPTYRCVESRSVRCCRPPMRSSGNIA